MGNGQANEAVVVVAGDGVVVGVERGLRERHDGWTRARQDEFCAALSRSGSVTFACRAVGLSTTNAYRTRKRMPRFAARWDAALAAIRPALEEAAFRRAVEGWDEPVFQGGRQVGVRRRYSDNLLRLLLLRGPAPADPAQEEEDAFELLSRKLDELARHKAAAERAKAIAWADDMAARGLAP